MRLLRYDEKTMLTHRKEIITRVVHNRQSGLLVVLEDIHDPHNAAAILRTCDAMGIQNVWFVFEKEKQYNPKRVGKSSSSSANKWLDFRIFRDTLSCFKTLKQKGYISIATALTDNSESLGAAKFPEKKIALWVGNEHAGLSDTEVKNADRVIQITMRGFVQSLNVSVATAITLWEITKQRGNTYPLSEKENKKLLEDFSKR